MPVRSWLFPSYLNCKFKFLCCVKKSPRIWHYDRLHLPRRPTHWDGGWHLMVRDKPGYKGGVGDGQRWRRQLQKAYYGLEMLSKMVWECRPHNDMKTISEKKCPKSQHFLNLMWFLASRRKKGKKKRLMPIYPKFSFGHVTGNMNLFFFWPKGDAT